MKLVKFTLYNRTPGGAHEEPVLVNPEKVIGLATTVAKRKTLNAEGHVDHSHSAKRESTLCTQIIYGQETENDYGCFVVIEDLVTVVGRLTK